MSLALVEPGTMAIVFTVEHERAAVAWGIRPVPLYGNGGKVIGSRIALGRDSAQERQIKEWMERISWAAREVYRGQPVEGPVAVEITDFRKRPDSQYGTGRNAGKLKEWAPRYPQTTPDLGKTARLIEDAMTGVVYADDSQIIEERLVKLYAPYGTQPRIEVVVWVLDTAEKQIPGQMEIAA